ncbi:MAG: universal stress protein [Mailhella sp.]|nr:universal stress protein [Mailhella sp.]
MGLFNTIACCIDLTEHNTPIVEYTREVAALTGANILLVHILPSASHLDSVGTTAEVIHSAIEDSRTSTENYVRQFAAQKFHSLPCEPLILTGRIDKALEELVDERCVDLIIMGSMNSHGLFNLVGHTTAQLIGHSRVPVLVIPNELNLECSPEE